MSVRKSLAWMTFSQATTVLFQFANTIVIARLLSPFDLGIYAAANSIIGILAIIDSFGVGSFIIREKLISKDALATAFTVNSAIVLTVSATILVLSPLGANFLHSDGVGHVMRVLALIPLLGLFEFLPSTNLEREGNFKAIATVNLVRGAVGTTTSIALALLGFSYMSLAWGAVASALVGAATFNAIGRRHVSLRLSLTSFRSIGSFGLQQLAIHGVNMASNRLSEIALGRLLGLSALGLYGRASNLNNLLWSNLYLVIGRILLVDFAEKNRQGRGLRDAYLSALEIMTAFLWPCFAGLAILARPLIRLVYGEKWLAAAPILSALSVTAMVLVAFAMCWELFVVCQRTAQQARYEFVRTSVGLGLFFGGCLIGLRAAACARIVDALFAFLIYRADIEDMTATSFSDFLPIYGRSLLLTLLACGPAIGLMTYYSWSPNTPFTLVVVSIGFGGIAWLVGLKRLSHPLLGEIQRLTRRLPWLGPAAA